MTAPGRDAIQRALEGVLDPCSIGIGRPVDICSLGLVEDVVVEGGHVRVTLILTDVTCVHYAGMRRHIADALSPIDGVDRVTVEMATSVVWTPDRVRDTSGLPGLSLTPLRRAASDPSDLQHVPPASRSGY